MVSVLGIFLLLLVAFAMSRKRSAIRWRTVGLAFGLQLLIGAMVFYAPLGRDGLEWISVKVAAVISAGNEGIGFLFGPLVEVDSIGFVFAFKVLPVIIFFHH